MEGRCEVETWADFGFSGGSVPLKLLSAGGTDVIICTGYDEVYVYDTKERKLRAVLQLPSPATDLVMSHDKQCIYVACDNGIYSVGAQLLQQRTQVAPSDTLPSPAEVKISSDFLIAEADGVSSLLLVGSVLLILGQRDASWLLTLYQTPQQAFSPSYEKLGSFSLPVVSADGRDGCELENGLRQSSVLICAHSGDVSQTSSSPSSSEASLSHDHFLLQPVLFKLLFGVDAALAKSSVILLGLQDGRLCFLPLRLPGSQLRVLHSLEQPIVFVGASAVMEMGHAQCLVAVGEQGRVVIIRTETAGMEKGSSWADFTEGCVPGPVVCACVDKKSLYYSTGSDLLMLDLSERSFQAESREGNKETSSLKAAALQRPTSLNVSRIIALTEPSCSPTGEVQLLGLSVCGHLQRISLPGNREDAGLAKLPSIQVGRSVKDLLSAIGDVCERASALRANIKSKNQILRHLNHLINISFILMDGVDADPPIREKPISCRAMTSWSRLLQKDSLNLVCVLDNSSPYVLEGGWTLAVTVFPLSCSPASGEEGSSTTFSFPFHSLCPGEAFEVSLPVGTAGDVSLPATVNCSLIFSLLGLLGDEEEAANAPDLQTSCISLPLTTLTVDWLHALRLNSPTASHKTTRRQLSGSIAKESIHTFIRSHQMRCSGTAEQGGQSSSKPEPEKYSAHVKVSSELLRDTLKVNTDLNGQNVPAQDLCLSLLDFLLTEAVGGVKMGLQGNKTAPSSLVVHGCGLDGAAIKLAVKELRGGEENTGQEESLMAVEVQVESSSITAVCGLHHAVLRRIQILLQRAPDKPASAQKVQILELRQTLQRAEVQQSQISGAFRAGMSVGQRNQFLLSIYQDLRNNPLLII
ncbi:Fanconi anemia core complex-associated protein 100 [Pholidichthys leucotaenia]